MSGLATRRSPRQLREAQYVKRAEIRSPRLAARRPQLIHETGWP